MYNWSTNEEEIKKDPEEYGRWRLEQLINYGLGGEKLSEGELRKYWDRLTIDPYRRKFLALLIYGEYPYGKSAAAS